MHGNVAETTGYAECTVRNIEYVGEGRYCDHSMNCCEYLDLRFGPRLTTDETPAKLPEEELFDGFTRGRYGPDAWMR